MAAIDLRVVQVDESWLQMDEKTVREVYSIVETARSRCQDLPIVVGTVEYSIFKRFLKSSVPVKFFPHEASLEADAKLYGEAQEFARALVLKVGGDLPFRGVNLFDVVLFDLTMQFHMILRIKHFVQCEVRKPGIIILLTGRRLKLFSGKSQNSELPIGELNRIGSRRQAMRRVVRYVVKFLLGAIRATRHEASGRIVGPLSGTLLDSDSERKRILFATIDTGTTNCAEPLAFILEELRKHSDLVPFVVVDNAFTEQYLKERGFECSKCPSFESWEGQFHWLRSRATFKRNTLQLMEQYGPATVQAQMVSAFSHRYLTARIPSELYSRILWLDRVFDGFRPDGAVIFPVYSHFCKIAVRLARLRCVPTLTFVQTWPHGAKPHPEYAMYDLADIVAGYGEQFKQTLAASGVNPDKIIPVGNPKFDAIPTRSDADDRRHVLELFGGKESGYILLVATYLIAPGSREWIRALVRQLKKLEPDRLKLVIRPHPDEGPEEYERILEQEKLAQAVVSKSLSLYTLINASDIVFTTLSTAGSEAVLFDKPLISINLTDIEYAVRYDKDGVAFLVKREEEILPAIDAVLHDKKVRDELKIARRHFQELYAYRLDGRASERFVNAIRLTVDRGRNACADSD